MAGEVVIGRGLVSAPGRLAPPAARPHDLGDAVAAAKHVGARTEGLTLPSTGRSVRSRVGLTSPDESASTPHRRNFIRVASMTSATVGSWQVLPASLQQKILQILQDASLLSFRLASQHSKNVSDLSLSPPARALAVAWARARADSPPSVDILAPSLPAGAAATQVAIALEQPRDLVGVGATDALSRYRRLAAALRVLSLSARGSVLPEGRVSAAHGQQLAQLALFALAWPSWLPPSDDHPILGPERPTDTAENAPAVHDPPAAR